MWETELLSKIPKSQVFTRKELYLALKEIEERPETAEPVIIETGKWHEGILGIVAGRCIAKDKEQQVATPKGWRYCCAPC